MSNKIDPKENVRFLVACIAHSSNGKPNFELVAKELNIISKGAASKRYERLLKSSGVTPGGKVATPADDGDEEPTTKPASKKRKAPAAAAAAPKSPAVKKAKAAPRGRKTKVKTEDDDVEDEDIKAESESSLSDVPEDLDVKAEDNEEA